LRGQEAFRQPHSEKSLNAATEYFRHALDIDPRFAEAYAGLCQAELGRYILSRNIADFGDSERACHRALTLNSDMPRVRAALGTLYLFSGQYEKAEEELRTALEANPNLIDAYADLAETLEYQGRLGEAEDLFESMVLRQPGYWYAHNALGNFLYRHSRYQEAASSWTTVTQLDSDNEKGFNNVAAAHYMLGDFAAASRAYEKSVEIEPYADNYSNLGLSYFYDGRYEEAARMQQRALELSPKDPRVYGRLATAYQYAGNEEAALPIYQEAISLLKDQLAINPNEIRYIRYLAVYNASIGQISEAQTTIERALELQPESSGVRFDAAKVALAAGEIDAALASLENAKELGYSTNIIRSDPAFEPLHSDERFETMSK
ncbi:MAG: tetratricopeptide repeat protein, partial [Gammaproteobacteria bacterium]